MRWSQRIPLKLCFQLRGFILRKLFVFHLIVTAVLGWAVLFYRCTQWCSGQNCWFRQKKIAKKINLDDWIFLVHKILEEQCQNSTNLCKPSIRNYGKDVILFSEKLQFHDDAEPPLHFSTKNGNMFVNAWTQNTQ